MPLPTQRVLFISYSHAYDEWSMSLNHAIFNTKLYFPFRDDRIPKTANWWHSLCENIEACTAVVAMLTPEYLKSTYCMAELEYAIKLEKPVIPIMVGLKAHDYPRSLDERNIQFIEADARWTEAHMRENILSAMNQVLIDYSNGIYPSADANFRPRSRHQRPPVPHPITPATAEDKLIKERIDELKQPKHRYQPTSNPRANREPVQRTTTRSKPTQSTPLQPAPARPTLGYQPNAEPKLAAPSQLSNGFPNAETAQLAKAFNFSMNDLRANRQKKRTFKQKLDVIGVALWMDVIGAILFIIVTQFPSSEQTSLVFGIMGLGGIAIGGYGFFFTVVGFGTFFDGVSNQYEGKVTANKTNKKNSNNSNEYEYYLNPVQIKVNEKQYSVVNKIITENPQAIYKVSRYMNDLLSIERIS